MTTPLRIAHWTLINGPSGLHHMAVAMSEADRRLGHDSALVDVEKPETWLSGHAIDADLHVVHTRFPDIQWSRIKNRTGTLPKTVFVSHGIPEWNMELALNQFNIDGAEVYYPHDYWMLTRHWMRVADAFVVLNPRQQAIYETMAQKGRIIDCVPMGVDTAFWAGGAKSARFEGQPAVWMSENQSRIKWALDVFTAWPFVLRDHPQAFLHAHYIVFDMQRFLVDFANSNGCAYRANITARTFSHESLRTMWTGFDFNLATTRYGDNTVLTMQAEAAGLKTISYPGNAYASYWMPEGDQRVMAKTLSAIFAGDVPMRVKEPVPSLEEMGRAMEAVYARVLDREVRLHQPVKPLVLMKQEATA